jgi:hypothetical protein
MIAVLVAALALQADPAIEKVERIAGDVHRPLLWTPLKITVSSAAGFSGDLVARSEFGFQTARKIDVAPGGRTTVLLPALDPRDLSAGKTLHKMSRDFVRPDRIVLVDTRLPYAAELVSTPQVLYQKISPEDLELTRPRGLLDVADLILTKDGPATREEAEKAVAALGDSPAQIEAVDRSLWTLAPAEGWVPTKKGWALYFAVVYAFGAFVALTVVARRYPKFGLACVAGVAVLGVAGAALLFPRHQVWFVSDRLEEASGRAHRVWFVNSAADLETSITFPMLVKPIFATSAGTEDPFTLRVDDRGCRVEGLKLGPGRSACFGATLPSQNMRMEAGALIGVVRLREGRADFVGRLPAGQPIAAVPEGGNPVHRSPGFDAWARFVGKNGFFGALDRDAVPSQELVCPDRADERERSAYIIGHLQ